MNWVLAKSRWDDLEYLIDKFHPSSKPKPITAQSAMEHIDVHPFQEAVRTVLMRNLPKRESPVEEAKKALEDRDANKFWNILNETWFGMPEAASVRLERGFHTLCSLLEE